jgi:hypothetical protein
VFASVSREPATARNGAIVKLPLAPAGLTVGMTPLAW